MEAPPARAERFQLVTAIWLTLPGAALCSIPLQAYLFSRLLPNKWVPTNRLLFDGAEILLALLVSVTFLSSRLVFSHCTSTNGHPRTRMILMLFNFGTQVFAEACVGAYFIVTAVSIGSWLLDS